MPTEAGFLATGSMCEGQKNPRVVPIISQLRKTAVGTGVRTARREIVQLRMKSFLFFFKFNSRASTTLSAEPPAPAAHDTELTV